MVSFLFLLLCFHLACTDGYDELSDSVLGATTLPSDSSGVFNVLNFGATGDGKTDDTLAVQEAINAASKATIVVSVPGMHDAVFSFATVFFPHGHYLLSKTLQLGHWPPNIMGFDRPILHMTNNTTDIFFGSNVVRWKASGLTFLGGLNQLHVGNNNTDKGQILIDDCTFLASGGAAIRLLEPSAENWPLSVGKSAQSRGRPQHNLVKFDGSFSTHVAISRCVFQGCAQALINWADWTTFERSWVTTSEAQPLDSAVFENHDRLFLKDVLGVPRETGHTAASRQRWVDNYAYRYDGGTLQMRRFRFGGEGSGLGGVFNFAPFACHLVRSNFSHLDLCGRIPHSATVAPPNTSIVPGSSITIVGSLVDTHQNILRLEEIPTHVDVSSNELRDGSGNGTLVFNVTDTIDLSGPLFADLLARASVGRRWLSYSVGKSNWNGPTTSGGVLPKELLPFVF